MSDSLNHVHNISPATKCRDRRGARSGPTDWTALFRDLGDQLDTIRRPSNGPADPGELAMTVVAEALAVAVALGDALGAGSHNPDQQSQSADPEPNTDSVAIYAGIDSRYLDHRARALRNALHSVDDFIWWGGLGAGQ
jgi:hypothetical protein